MGTPSRILTGWGQRGPGTHPWGAPRSRRPHSRAAAGGWWALWGRGVPSAQPGATPPFPGGGGDTHSPLSPGQGGADPSLRRSPSRRSFASRPFLGVTGGHGTCSQGSQPRSGQHSPRSPSLCRLLARRRAPALVAESPKSLLPSLRGLFARGVTVPKPAMAGTATQGHPKHGMPKSDSTEPQPWGCRASLAPKKLLEMGVLPPTLGTPRYSSQHTHPPRDRPHNQPWEVGGGTFIGQRHLSSHNHPKVPPPALRSTQHHPGFTGTSWGAQYRAPAAPRAHLWLLLIN